GSIHLNGREKEKRKRKITLDSADVRFVSYPLRWEVISPPSSELFRSLRFFGASPRTLKLSAWSPGLGPASRQPGTEATQSNQPIRPGSRSPPQRCWICARSSGSGAESRAPLGHARFRIFLCSLLPMNPITTLLEALHSDPGDDTAWLALADAL